MTDSDTLATTTSIVLIRHGESVANAQGLIAGHRSCQGLNDVGRGQVMALARRLSSTGELDGAVLVASNFPRAIETATILGPTLGVDEPIIDAAFGELDPGSDWDARSFDDFFARHPDRPWPTDPSESPFPGGETIGEFHARVSGGLERIAAAYEGMTIAVATHGGVIDMAFRYITGVEPTGVFQLRTDNASLTGLTWAPSRRWRIDRYNDGAHLHAGAWLDDDRAAATAP